MLNGINKKGLSKNHNVKIVNFAGIATETILDEVDLLIHNNPGCIIISITSYTMLTF